MKVNLLKHKRNTRLISFILGGLVCALLLSRFHPQLTHAANYIFGSDQTTGDFTIRDSATNKVKLRIDSTGSLLAQPKYPAQSDNLLLNGGFEGDIDGDSVPDNWTTGYNSAAPCALCTFSLDTAIGNAREGVKWLKVTTTAAGQTASFASDAFNVIPGQYYNASIDAIGNYSGFAAKILFFLPTGTTTWADADQADAITFAATSTTASWATYSANDFVAPTTCGGTNNQACTRARLYIASTPGAASTRYFDMARVILSNVSQPINAQYVSSGTLGAAFGTQNFYFNGNVGIGTTGPSTKLDIVGGVKISNGINVAGGTVTLPASSVANAALANSSVTISNGTNITGGGALSLGGTLTLGTVTNPTFSGLVTASNGLTVSAGTITLPASSIDSADVSFNYAASGSKGGAATDLSCTTCVANAELASSSVTISNGTNITGGGALSLGGTLTLGTVTNPTFSGLVTASNGLTVSAGTITLPANSLASAAVNFNYAGSSSKGGAASTATALAANGTDCAAGNYPLGVDSSGNAISCTAAFTAASTLTGFVRSTAVGASYFTGGSLGIGTTGPSTPLDVVGGVKISNGLNVAGGTVTLPANTVASAAVNFNYAASGSKGGAATDVSCTNCVDSAEANFNYAGSSSKGGAASTATALAANGTNCGAGNYPLGIDASGNAESCTAAPSGTVGGSGTQNYVTKWNNAGGTTIGNSLIYDNGTNVGIGTTIPGAKLDVNGAINTNSNISAPSGTITAGGAVSGLNVTSLNDVTGVTGKFSGNVAIGTSGADQRITVGGNIHLTSAGGVSYGYVYSDGSNFGLLNNGGSWGLYIPNGTQSVLVPGSLGIGAAPAVLLDVTGSATGANVSINVRNTAGSAIGAITAAESAGVGFIRVGAVSAQDLRFITGDSARAAITAAGNFGIGTTAPGTRLAVAGLTSSQAGRSICSDASGNFYYYAGSCIASSRTVKENISTYTPNIDNVLQLDPVKFQYKDSHEEDIGYIAEDAAKLTPDLISYNNGQISGFKYEKLPVYLLELDKKQQQQIDDLKSQVQELKQQIDELKAAKSPQSP